MKKYISTILYVILFLIQMANTIWAITSNMSNYTVILCVFSLCVIVFFLGLDLGEKAMED